MAKEVDLDKVNADYPCDMRKGYGKGCKCHNGGVDKALLHCAYYRRNIKVFQCEACRYQKKYVQNINNESTE